VAHLARQTRISCGAPGKAGGEPDYLANRISPCSSFTPGKAGGEPRADHAGSERDVTQGPLGVGKGPAEANVPVLVGGQGVRWGSTNQLSHYHYLANRISPGKLFCRPPGCVQVCLTTWLIGYKAGQGWACCPLPPLATPPAQPPPRGGGERAG
jgi:hypothetical protein